ncbi:MAG TPA: class I SAM-dependent methyltransferase [Candidatus Eisenbacteria bacterium]|nr:class I SAM-dependent methyltransferase [Candidatus Eisenbacteria bacterium]
MMSNCSDFWNALAPFHAEIEDTNFDLASVRRLLPEIKPPVLIVGAGQGLIVAELRKCGYECDGIDLNSEMIRQAKLRRGISLIQADARAMSFAAASYETIIYATGVVDFTAEEDQIQAMLTEGRRVVRTSGKIFVAFCKGSAAQEKFLAMVGLLSEGTLALRESLEVYLLNPVQMIEWITKRASLSRFRATLALLRVSALSTMQEKRTTLRMQRVFRKIPNPRALINAAPEKLPYRNQREIENLFKRLDIPIKQLSAFASCWVFRI